MTSPNDESAERRLLREARQILDVSALDWWALAQEIDAILATPSLTYRDGLLRAEQLCAERADYWAEEDAKWEREKEAAYCANAIRTEAEKVKP